MSLYNKKTLAMALALAMAAPSAYAFTVTTGAGEDADLNPEQIASQVGPEVTMTEPVNVEVELGDIIVGRTTGFQLLVTLRDGAQFTDTPPVLVVGDAATGWTATLVAGGTEGSNRAQFTFQPGETDARISTGIIATIAGLNLQNVSTANNSVTRAEFLLRDPVSTATLHSYTPNLIVRNNGLQVTCTPEEQPNRIDVGENETYEPKTAFVEYPYAIGDADTLDALLGEITVTATSNLQLAEDDSLTSVITGNLGAFDAMFLSADQCETALASYEINEAGTSATLTEDLSVLGMDGAGGAASLCVTANGEDQIAAQTLSVQNTVTMGEIDIAGGACPVAPLQYNGSVVNVYHVNPAGNSTAQSFVRVINPSDLSGNVTVVGWDDAGNAAGPITFELPARASKQFNSVDLEQGAAGKGITGSFGDGVGKWRLEVTGEFEGMIVQGLNRNQDDGTVTNLTDADAQVEQELLHRGNFNPAN